MGNWDEPLDFIIEHEAAISAEVEEEWQKKLGEYAETLAANLAALREQEPPA